MATDNSADDVFKLIRPRYSRGCCSTRGPRTGSSALYATLAAYHTTYKDKALWKAIQAAKKNPKTTKLGTKSETELLIIAEKQPIDVVKLMNVRENSSANWKLWKSHMQD